MKAKTTAMLCEASFVAGAVLTPPILRKTRERVGVVARRGAMAYVKARERVSQMGEATGRPGRYAIMPVKLGARASTGAFRKWREMVHEAEAERAGRTPDRFGHFRTPEPSHRIEDYVGSPS